MFVCVCVSLMATLSASLEIPELVRRGEDRRGGKKNQCELFIQGSNPQIYCHLICGYGVALMALMLSNRCFSSTAGQVGPHLRDTARKITRQSAKIIHLRLDPISA